MKSLDSIPPNSGPIISTTETDATATSRQSVQTETKLSVRRFVVPLALVLILAFAALVRFVGVNWDENQHLHPDERFLTMVETAVQLPSSVAEYFDTDKSPLNPYNKNFGLYVYGTFPLFVTRFTAQLIQPIGQAIVATWLNAPAPSYTGTLADLRTILSDSTGYDGITLVGRSLSAAADLLTVLLVFFIGRRMYGTRVGLLSALLLAASALDIQQSHFFTVDTFSNVPILLAFWFALDVAEGGSWPSFALSGGFLGLAVAGRINTAAFAIIIALAAVLYLIRRLNDSLPVVPPRASSGIASRNYSLYSEALAAQGDAASGHHISGEDDATKATITTRVIRLGPLAIELDWLSSATDEASAEAAIESGGLSVPTHVAEQEEAQIESIWNRPVVHALVGLALAAFASLLVFRIAQPYAFKGLFGLNPKFLQDMNYVRDLIAGNIDYPPGHQWTDRTPFFFPLSNMILWGMGPALGIASWAGFILAGMQMLRRRNWIHLLIFFWVGGLFLYMGSQFVSTSRYYLPLYPFFALLAAYFLFWLLDWAGRASAVSSLSAGLRRFWPRIVALAAFVVVVGYTLFWGTAYATIYTRPVTRVAASRWMFAHIPTGSVIMNEHWDDALPLRVDGKDPFGGMYKGLTSSQDGLAHWYDEDTPEKRIQAISWLDEADYIVLSSNRLYLSIPRLPLRYPMTTKYYESLFSGKLGFELIATFTSHPQLFGLQIDDDSAEEILTVYDHPKVLIFKKTSAYSHENTAALFGSVDLSEVFRQKPLDATISHNAFQLSSADKAAAYEGGTWSDIFNPDNVVNRFPIIVWLVLLEILGLIGFPFAFLVFRNMADRGFAFAKALSVLLLGWGAWTLASYHLLPFSRGSILFVLFALAVFAAFMAWRHRNQISTFWQQHSSILILEEIVFLVFFVASLLIRYGNPDLWHPNFGGEKPMDFAYLNAIIKTTWFPPYNPWFEGGYINYYYFGQLLSATLVKMTGIVPEVAYNLLLPMFFGLTGLGAFGVAFNLVFSAQTRAFSSLAGNSEMRFRPNRAILAGLLASFFVLILGNLGEVGVLGHALMLFGQQVGGQLPGNSGLVSVFIGVKEWLMTRTVLPIPIGDWYWTATRVIPDTINEFPFFTFLYADLHAHLMSFAYTLMALGLAVHAVLLRGRLRLYDVAATGLVLGSLRAINTWDYPTYLALTGAALVVGYFAHRSQSDSHLPDWGERLQRYLMFVVLAFVQVALLVIPANMAGVKVTTDILTFGLVIAFGLVLGWIVVGGAVDPVELARGIGWRFILIVGLAIVFFWPFVSNYGTAYTSVELWKDNRTSLQDYLVVHGIFLFVVLTFFLVEALRTRAKARAGERREPALEAFVYFLPGLALFETALFLMNLRVFALVIPIVLLGIWLLLGRDAPPERRFIALLMVAGLLMTLMVEVIVIKGDIGRMNTVFKFYLQAWIMFGVAGAAGLALIFNDLNPYAKQAPAEAVTSAAPTRPHYYELKRWWWAAFAVLIVAGLVYPIFATWAKVNDRYVPGSPAGLNGLQYMLNAHYGENNQDFALEPDYQAIQWIRTNIKGSPVLAEANTGLYHWGNRISINTGLPTIIGWDWHTKQQYSLIDGAIIDHRVGDVASLYSSPDPSAALELIRRYGVSYIYVGPLERAVYDANGLGKFELMAATGTLSKVYDADGVQLYQVNPAANALLR